MKLKAKSRVTSAQVARRAEVSQSAVSRTFTPGASVAPHTREKVMDTARELGYRPNAIARSLISGRSRMIGLVAGYLDNQFYPIVDDPWRELSAVLTIDDIEQMGLSLEGEAGNPKVTEDVEEHIGLRASGTERTLLSDIVERFAKRPYGWPDAETLLIVGRLAAAGRISFQHAGATLPVKDAFESMQNSRRRREVSILKKRQIDEAVLKQARKLTQDLFSTLGPSTEAVQEERDCHACAGDCVAGQSDCCA